ncbi:MAG: DUF4442 domain-containing protein [Flavobacteriaceae bacterium]
MNIKTINKMLMFKLPSAYLCGVRLKELNRNSARVDVTYKWINQNPFRSMYFAVQSMAAELSTGSLILREVSDRKEKFSMLVVGHQGDFTKKAVGKINFTCDGGEIVKQSFDKALATGEGVSFTLYSQGIDGQGDVVSNYSFKWSIKLKKK